MVGNNNTQPATDMLKTTKRNKNSITNIVRKRLFRVAAMSQIFYNKLYYTKY